MSDASPSPGAATSRVDLGRFVLVVGDRAGAAIEDAANADAKHHDPDLGAAVAQSSKEPSPQPSKGPGPIGETIEDASEVTDRVEHALKLFDEFANERRDLASLSDEADLLLDLLQRLDRHGRWAEAIRVARALSKLLALLARWKELLHSLRLALSLAERLGDDDGMAWALHELGTLHLAVNRHAAGDSLLTHAREIRQRTGDRHALAITERNLQVLCRALRADLHRSRWHRFKQLPNARTLAVAFTSSLLVVGGAAGAFINGSRGGPTPPTSRDGAILGSTTQTIIVTRYPPPHRSVKHHGGEQSVKHEGGETGKQGTSKEEGQTSKPTEKPRTLKLTGKIARTGPG